MASAKKSKTQKRRKPGLHRWGMVWARDNVTLSKPIARLVVALIAVDTFVLALPVILRHIPARWFF
jgi:hypothetical protein